MRRLSLTFVALFWVILGAVPAAAQLVASVLPASRAVVVNATATAFATIINAGTSAVTNCSIALPSGTPATFLYQTTNPSTNAPTGTPNTPVGIAAGAAQTFYFAITPTSTFTERDIALVFSCGSASVTSIVGVNTFLLTSSTTATPDVVALAATISNDGIARTPGTNAAGAFSVATINVGAAGNVIASVDNGGVSVNAGFTICQTNSQAQCLAAPAASVNTSFTSNQAGTFSIFMTASGLVALDPAVRRAFVRFKSGGITIGATSVAIETQTALAENGGTLQLGDVNLEVAAESLLTTTDFTAASTQLPASLPEGFVSAGASYAITPTNAAGAPNNGLEAPVSLTIPYSGVSDPSKLAVLHYNAGLGEYEMATTLNINTESSKVSFDSRNFSSFILVIINLILPSSAQAPDFVPNASGFAVVNTGTQFLSPGGNCLGMSAFATWFYSNKGHTGLFSRWSTTSPGPSPQSIQDLVAFRAHIMQGVYWNNLYNSAGALAYQRANRDYMVTMLRYNLAAFRRPIVLIVGTAASPTAHAIVAYGYTSTNILIYDPNSPGSVVQVPYTNSGIGTYGSYTQWAFIGTPSFGGADSFASISNQADGGFAGSSNLNVTSPTQNQNVTQNQVSLTGSLSGSLNSLSRVYYWKNGQTGFTQVPVSGGSFTRTIDVSSGQNNLIAIAGVTAYSNQLSNTLANAATKVVRFNGPPATRFRSTLTWDQTGDIDQYVTEPTGATSWYSSRTTAGGLTLDFDNTSGFGPENTTLLASRTPIAGNYRVRVHYYSGSGAKSGRVVIVLNERETNQVGPRTRLWSLSVPNSGNASPGSSGSDWVDIANVNVVNGVITLL